MKVGDLVIVRDRPDRGPKIILEVIIEESYNGETLRRYRTDDGILIPEARLCSVSEISS